MNQSPSHSLCLLLTFVFLFTLVFSVAAEQQIFVIREPDGSLLFSTWAPKDGRQAEVFSARGARYSYSVAPGLGGRLFSDRYREEIHAAANRYGIDEALIRAVIHAESAFNSRAVSPKGAVGLMQIMPANFQAFHLREPFEPGQNIAAGTRYLAELLKSYNGNLRLALAAYNAGPGAVSRYGGIPPFPETQQYVRRVLHFYSRYQRVAS